MNAGRARSSIAATVGSADCIQLERKLGEGVELVLTVGDEVVGTAEAADRFGRAGDDLPPLPAGSHDGAVTRQPSGSRS